MGGVEGLGWEHGLGDPCVLEPFMRWGHKWHSLINRLYVFMTHDSLSQSNCFLHFYAKRNLLQPSRRASWPYPCPPNKFVVKDSKSLKCSHSKTKMVYYLLYLVWPILGPRHHNLFLGSNQQVVCKWNSFFAGPLPIGLGLGGLQQACQVGSAKYENVFLSKLKIFKKGDICM